MFRAVLSWSTARLSSLRSFSSLAFSSLTCSLPLPPGRWVSVAFAHTAAIVPEQISPETVYTIIVLRWQHRGMILLPVSHPVESDRQATVFKETITPLLCSTTQAHALEKNETHREGGRRTDLPTYPSQGSSRFNQKSSLSTLA